MSFATIQLITHPRNKPVLKVTNGAFEAGIIQLLDENGKPIDLTLYDTTRGQQSDDSTPVTNPRYLPLTRGIVFYASAYYGQNMPDMQKVCAVQGDPTNGEVYLEIEPNDLRYPGMYLCSIFLCSEGVVKQAFEMYVESAPSVAWSGQPHPLTISEIRLWSRDWAPEVNDLLDEVEYKDAEIAAAIRRGIDLWNSTPPLLRMHTYTPSTFPAQYRSQWIDVTIGFLKIMAADWYERNHLPYQAGGVTINDRNKFQGYRQDGYQRMQNYQSWMKDIKVQLNMQGGWGRTGYMRLP
jgi:hypothetical protein